MILSQVVPIGTNQLVGGIRSRNRWERVIVRRFVSALLLLGGSFGPTFAGSGAFRLGVRRRFAFGAASGLGTASCFRGGSRAAALLAGL